MALGNGLSFIFDTSKGETPESVARKRALAAAIMGQIGNRSARNAGEGIGNAFASIGQGIQTNVLNRRADAASEAGQSSANSVFDDLRRAIAGEQQFPAAPGGGEVATAGDDNYRDAIASIESAGSGDYSAVGPTNKKLGRALGRYQVMEANIGPWSKAALGREVTPQEFMANPQIQDAIFDHQFGSYVQKYGNPQDAASAWFTGQPLSKGANRRDVLGTSGAGYVDKFSRALGGAPAVAATEAMASGQPMPEAPQQVASLDPSIGMAQASPIPMQPGQELAGDPAHSAFIQRMADPQSMTGGSPMPMQGMPPAQQMSQSAPQQMAQAAPSGPDMSQIPVTAGGNAGVHQPGQMSSPSLQQLMQAANNPWLNEQQRGIINMMLKQQMEQNDPMRSLDMEYKRAQIGALNAKGSGPAELGLNPQYGVDAQGNPVLIQIGKDGKAVQTAMPEGVQLSKEPIKMDAGTHFVLLDPITRQAVGQIPKENYQESFDKGSGAAAGKAQAEAAASLPTDLATSEQAISEIDALIKHPGLSTIAGPFDQYRPSWTMGAEGRDALARFNQAKGRAFLQAFGMLKGGGQITEIEGQKAEQAMARMDRAQGEAEFKQALQDFRDAVAAGMDKMRQRAGGGARQPVSIGGYTIEQVD